MKKSLIFSLLATGALCLALHPAALAQEHGDTVKVPQAKLEVAPVKHMVTNPNTTPFTKKVNPKDGLTYEWIPPGKFMMGCAKSDAHCDADETRHEVTIARGFWISTTPVTQAAYKRVMGVDPSSFKGPERPVERVSWGDAYRYCKALGMRIPSEEEYEYAARAGNTSDRYGKLDDIAWYKGNSNGHTHPVAEKEPNAWGLYDMLGNVWEYTSDAYNPADPVYVAMRGGGWVTSAQGIRFSFRGFDSADVHRNFSGFRCVGD